MKNQFLKSDLEIQSPKEEVFPEIHKMVEGLLASIQESKEKGKKKSRSSKKWKKKPKKAKKLEDLGIRELPFTF